MAAIIINIMVLGMQRTHQVSIPYYVGAGGGGMASGALWSIGLGIDVDVHSGGVVVAGGRGGCMANYWHVNASIKFEMGPSDWTVTDFQLGSGGGVESLALLIPHTFMLVWDLRMVPNVHVN